VNEESGCEPPDPACRSSRKLRKFPLAPIHGYIFGYDPTTDEVAWTSEWPAQERPWLRARHPFGRIAIANCDAANNAMTEASFSEAHRAVREVLGG
jgi:hypothetical protein